MRAITRYRPPPLFKPCTPVSQGKSGTTRASPRSRGSRLIARFELPPLLSKSTFCGECSSTGLVLSVLSFPKAQCLVCTYLRSCVPCQNLHVYTLPNGIQTSTVPSSPSAGSAQALRVGHNFISLSIRGAGHKFDRPPGGNSRLQREILQLKNEEAHCPDVSIHCWPESQRRPAALMNPTRSVKLPNRWWGRGLQIR